MNVVTSAITTIMEKNAGEITPISRPTLRMTSSIRPRVFIRTPTAVDSRQPVPAHRAAIKQPPSLPTIAISITMPQTNHMRVPSISRMLVLKPVNAKYNGNRSSTVVLSNLSRMYRTNF